MATDDGPRTIASPRVLEQNGAAVDRPLHSSKPYWGIALMSLATLLFAGNDTLLKLATSEISPFIAMFYRGVAAVFWCVPALAIMGRKLDFRHMIDRWVLARGLVHVAAVFCFMASLPHLPIGNLVALGQLAPAIVVIGVIVVYGERTSVLQLFFVGLAFAGAMLLSRPEVSGLSTYVVLGLASAVLSASRDLIGRQIPVKIPVLLVVVSNLALEVIGSGVVTTIVPGWTVPHPIELAMIAGSGLLLVVGHSLFFLSYRLGSIGRVAPFYYLYPVWSFAAGMVVFGDPLNIVSVVGTAMILTSGIAIFLTGKEMQRHRPA